MHKNIMYLYFLTIAMCRQRFTGHLYVSVERYLQRNKFLFKYVPLFCFKIGRMLCASVVFMSTRQAT